MTILTHIHQLLILVHNPVLLCNILRIIILNMFLSLDHASSKLHKYLLKVELNLMEVPTPGVDHSKKFHLISTIDHQRFPGFKFQTSCTQQPEVAAPVVTEL